MIDKAHIQNTFSQGVRLGVAAAQQDNQSARLLENMRFLSAEGETLLLSNFRGTALATALPTGHLLLGHATLGAVAYLFSLNPVTGEGEVGSFPSPGAGRLVDVYTPLQNFLRPDGSYGAFRTAAFGFSAERPLEVEAQAEYDGSVNLIFHDRFQPPRLLNTGFAADPEGRVTFPDRTGQVESNRYQESSFGDSMLLQQRSRRLLDVVFGGVHEGGRQKAGTYRYYFRYATQEGNLTDIVAESGLVAVGHGTRVATTRGGRGDGEDTTKATRFTLRHLDTAYAAVKVYFVLTLGERDELPVAYELEQPLPIAGHTRAFTHTGFEAVQRIDVRELWADSPDISRVGAMAQSQGHLLLGDIHERPYDRDLLASFAARVAVGARQHRLDQPGTEAGMARVFGEGLQQDTPMAGTAGWNGGYANPMNVYHRTGYFGGETYPFALRFLFPNGTCSPAFPTRGYDQAGNALSAEAALARAVEADGLAPGEGMVNTRGIFRFPNRTAPGMDDLCANGQVTVLGVTFRFPPADDALFQRIRQETVGVQVLRAARRPDLLAQGLVLPTYSLPNQDMTAEPSTNEPDKKVWGWFNKYTDSKVHEGEYSDKYLDGDFRMVLPLPEGHAEGMIWLPGKDAKQERGVFPVHLYSIHVDPKRLGFYSLDVQQDTARFANLLNNRSVTAAYVGRATLRRAFPFEFTRNGLNWQAPALLRQVRTVRKNNRPAAAGTAHYSPEGAQRTLATNNKFGSYVQRVNLECGNDWVKIERLMLGEYVGLHLPAETLNDELVVQPDKASPSVDDGPDAARVLAMGTVERAAYNLVNLYGEGGQLTAAQVWERHRDIEALEYFPISPRMYWSDQVPGADPKNTLEGRLDAQRELSLFGGDCFVGIGYKRLYYGAVRTEDNMADTEYVGQGIAICQEAAYNMCFRVTEKGLDTEGEPRSFFPAYRADEANRRLFFKHNKNPEAAVANHGYRRARGDKPVFALPLSAPYIAARWPFRVMASGKHIPNAFQNGYRQFAGLALQDYHGGYGRITRLVAHGGALLALFERAAGYIPLNERVQTGGDAAGAIFVESAGLLSPAIGLITEAFGCPVPWLAVATDNAVYLADTHKGALLRIGGPQQPAEILSDLTLEPMLRQQLPQWAAGNAVGGHGCVAAFDADTREVLFSFYRDGGGMGFTVVYSERQQVMNGLYRFTFHGAFSLGGRFFSLPSEGERHGIHAHGQGPYQTFYGQRQHALLRFVANPAQPGDVVFDTLAVRSNHVLPAHARLRVQGALAEMDVAYDPEDPVQSNAKYLRGHAWLVLPLVTAPTGEGAAGLTPAGSDNAQPEVAPGARLIGPALDVELRYETDRLVQISETKTFFR